MAKLNFSGNIPMAQRQESTNLRVLAFEEDGVLILYVPALDIVGTGYDHNQARA